MTNACWTARVPLEEERRVGLGGKGEELGRVGKLGIIREGVGWVERVGKVVKIGLAGRGRCLVWEAVGEMALKV